MQHIPYCSDHHRITKELEAYVCDLLALGTYTNKQVAELCGLHQHTVKAIDKRRLEWECKIVCVKGLYKSTSVLAY